LIGTYTEFENFLRELFKHEHFLEISSIEIKPYQKNKRILLISMQVKLYAQRDPSSIVETPDTEEASSSKSSKKSKAKSSTKKDKKDKGDDVPPDIKKEQ
jgi:hypothetical protein